MSSPSANPNPFARFALAAPTAAAPAASSFHSAAPARPADSSPAKKIRTALDVKPRGRQESPKGLQEKYRSPGEPEWPLRLIIVGHNPSEKAWELGHYYANPSNRMWKLLSAAGIVPPGFVAADDDDCPIKCGVGFTDVGFSHPGTVSSEFKRAELHAWRQDFYDRLSAHAERAAARVACVKAVAANAGPSTAAGAGASAAAVKMEPAAAATGKTGPAAAAVKTEPAAASNTKPAAAAAAATVRTEPVAAAGVKTEPTTTTTLTGSAARDAVGSVSIEAGCPKIVAFAGKRQWEELFFDASAQAKAQTKGGKAGQFRFGLQPAALRPPGWPFPAQATEVFVVPSSSGAAAMTNEAREGPYRALGEHMSRTGQWAWRDEASRARVKAPR